ncbi:MAG: hypothetical protein JWQ84_1065, partial [Mucilaginibacter sp.]|nr:hypothetical protein [Mucilaginibacter sp.]
MFTYLTQIQNYTPVFCPVKNRLKLCAP